MPMLQRPDCEIYYEEFGSGFPILLFAPGGLRSNLAMWHHRADRNFARHCPVPTFRIGRQPATNWPGCCQAWRSCNGGADRNSWNSNGRG